MIYFKLIFAILISISTAVYGESNQTDEKIEIIVLKKGAGTPIKRAEVRVGKQIFFTDPKGSVKIQITATSGKVLIQKQGYENLFIEPKDLKPSEPYKAYLLPGEPDDNEVIVRGKRRPAVSRKTIDVRETKRIAPNGDPAQITKLLPGVQTNSFRSDVIIRGSGPSDSKYFIDDLEVPFIFHQVGNISVFSERLLSDVDFSSGGFGPQYGNATGGIIALRTTSTVPEKSSTELKLNVPFLVSSFYETPLAEDSAVAVSLRRSTLELILAGPPQPPPPPLRALGPERSYLTGFGAGSSSAAPSGLGTGMERTESCTNLVVSSPVAVISSVPKVDSIATSCGLRKVCASVVRRRRVKDALDSALFAFRTSHRAAARRRLP